MKNCVLFFALLGVHITHQYSVYIPWQPISLWYITIEEGETLSIPVDKYDDVYTSDDFVDRSFLTGSLQPDSPSDLRLFHCKSEGPFVVRDIPFSYNGTYVTVVSPKEIYSYRITVLQLREEIISSSDSDRDRRCYFDAPNAVMLKCQMFLESQQKWTDGCPWVKLEKNDTMRCRALVKGSSDALRTKTRFIVEEEDKRGIQVDMPKYPPHFVCSAPKAVKMCFAENLDTGEIFNLEDDLGGDTVTSWGTSLRDGKCIFRPKLRKMLLYTWRVTMIGDEEFPHEYHGCLFNPTQSDVLLSQFKKQFETVEDVPHSLGRTNFSCPIAPYPLTHCFLRTSSNEIINPNPEVFKRTAPIGLCVFTDVKLPTGELVCSLISRYPGGVDLQKRYNLVPYYVIDQGSRVY